MSETSRLSDFIARYDFAIVLLHASWEWYHPAVRRSLDAVLTEAGERAGLLEIDVDAAPELAVALKIRNVPTVLVYERGEPAQTFIGVRPAERYLERWRTFRENHPPEAAC